MSLRGWLANRGGNRGREVMRAVVKVVLSAAVVWTVFFLRGNIYFRLYPAVVCFVAWLLFILASRKTPLVEIIARKRGERLDERGVKYCRKVNNAWIVFLSLHLAVTVATVFASELVWAFYNGFLAYALIGLMFSGEWIVRRRIRGKGAI